MMKVAILLVLAVLGANASRSKFNELVEKVHENSATEETESTSTEELAALLQVGEGKYVPPATLDPKFSLKPTIMGKGTVIDKPFKPKVVNRNQLTSLKQTDRLAFERSKWVTRRMKKIIGDDLKTRKVNIHTGGVAKIVGKTLDGKFNADLSGKGPYVEATIIGYTPARPVPKKNNKFVKPEISDAARKLFRKEVKAGRKKNPGKFTVKPKKSLKPNYVSKKANSKKGNSKKVNKVNSKKVSKPQAKKGKTPSWASALKAAVKKVNKVAKSAAPKAGKAGKKTNKPIANKIGKALAGKKAPKVDFKSLDVNQKLNMLLNKLATQDAFEDVLADEQALKLTLAAEKSAEAAAFAPAILNGQSVNNERVMGEIFRMQNALKYIVEKVATADVLEKASVKREATINNKVDKLTKAVRYLVAKAAGIKAKAAGIKAKAVGKAKAAGIKGKKFPRDKHAPKRPFRGHFHRFEQEEESEEEEVAAEDQSEEEDAVTSELMEFMQEAEAAAEEEEENSEEEESEEESEEEESEEEEEAEEESEEEEAEEESEEEEAESFLEVAGEEEEEEEEEAEEEEEEEEEAEEEEEEGEESFLEVSEEESEEEEESHTFFAKIEGDHTEEEGDIIGGPQRSDEEMEAEDQDEDVVVKLAEKNAAGAFLETEAEEEEEEEVEAEEEEEEAESEEAEEEEEEEQTEEEEQSEEQAPADAIAPTGNSFIDNNESVIALRSAIESIQAELQKAKAEQKEILGSTDD